MFYLALLIPWIAALVYRAGGGAIHLFVGKGDRRPNVTHVYSFACMSPGMWVLTTLAHPLRWEFLIVIGLVIGSLLAAVAVKDRRTWHWVELLLLLALNSFYGFGVAAAFNHDLDSGSPQIYRPQVLAKRSATSRRHNNYYLKLAPWGPRASSAEVQVGSRDYESVPLGSPACVELRSGALGVPWFLVSRCNR